jgi:cobalt-zinc-cadmium efflux system outer membrane protein
MLSHRIIGIMALLTLAGCHVYPDPTDDIADALSKRIRDPEPGASVLGPAAHPANGQQPVDMLPAPDTEQIIFRPLEPEQEEPGKEANQEGDKTQGKKLHLVIPADLPGSNAPPIVWPKTPAEQEKFIQKFYPAPPPLPAPLQVQPGPEGHPLTLSELQGLAAANNPSIRAAVAAVQAARGAVIQAGAYPNPSIFWQDDTVGTGGAGYQGGGVEQTIKGANKIKLSRAMAVEDLHNTELALRKAQADLATQVRSAYFAALVQRENVKVSRALAVFAENVYRVQVELLSAGKAAPYEPIQLRPLVLQSRLNLIQATNQYLASWRQLAAALGLPGMPLTDLAGGVDLPVPVYDYETVVQVVLNNHTDVLTALNNVQKARYAEELARANVYPDVDLHLHVQKDYTGPPDTLVYGLVVRVPVPVWDQKKGDILQAKHQITQALEIAQQDKLQLLNTLADAFNRYSTTRESVQVTMFQIQDQVRAYRGVYERRAQAPDDVSFGDIVAAQQTLAAYISAYITALANQWQAVVDIANLLQTEDLFQTGRMQEVFPIPHLETLPPAPCLPVWHSSIPGESDGGRDLSGMPQGLEVSAPK